MEGRRARVLVVDDEAPLAKTMRRALEDEHEVVVVTSATEAVERIRGGERFDLILCDLMLPGLSGVDFHGWVGRHAPELVKTIVFSSGGAYTPHAAAFLRRADVRHIEKPFPSLPELRALIREHLQRIRAEGGGIP